MTCGIYSIIHKKSGKVYIGKSINIETRFQQHCSRSHNKTFIDMEINRLGVNSFDFKIICECKEEELDIEEQKFIRLYNSFNQGYNLTTGGDGGRLSQETKEKIAKQHTSTGFLNVHKVHLESSFQGFIWSYKYTDKNGNRIGFMNVDLNKLEKTVIENELPWKVINKTKATQSQKENDFYLSNLKKTTNTGFLGVSKTRNKRVKQGFIYQYNTPYNPKGINSSFGSVSFERLRDKVLNKGLPWGIVDKDKAMENGLL